MIVCPLKPGESKMYRPRRPRSSSDALSTAFNGDLLDSRQHCNSYDNVGHGDSDGDDGPICVPALISPPRSTDDVDLSPPDIGMATLDFDPMSFQCSLPLAESSVLSPEVDAASLKRSPGSVSDSEPVSPVQAKVTSPYHSPDLSPAKQMASSERAIFWTPESNAEFCMLAPLSISEPTDTSICSKEPEGSVIQHFSISSPQDSSAKTGLLSLNSTDLPLSEAIQLELLSKSALCECKESKEKSVNEPLETLEKTGMYIPDNFICHDLSFVII